MLLLKVPALSFYDNDKEVFIETKEYELRLEHSLVSLSKWESKWKKPFLSKKDKTKEETLYYIKCMTINQNSDQINYELLPQSIIDRISEYIDDPMTATTFVNPDNKKTNREVVTAELIYYWMIAFNIPPDYDKWHLNRLLTLINVCNIKNQPQKKMSAKELRALQARNKSINDARKAQYNTSG